MVSFTALVSAISMALLTSTANAAPCAPDYTAPPPTDSVLDFTLYKTNGNELQCWTHAPGNSVVHVAPKETGKCITADFYALNIDSNHNGVYGCKIEVWENYNCDSDSNPTGTYTDPNVCKTTSYGSRVVNLHSYKVTCSNLPAR